MATIMLAPHRICQKDLKNTIMEKFHILLNIGRFHWFGTVLLKTNKKQSILKITSKLLLAKHSEINDWCSSILRSVSFLRRCSYAGQIE